MQSNQMHWQPAENTIGVANRNKRLHTGNSGSVFFGALGHFWFSALEDAQPTAGFLKNQKEIGFQSFKV